MQWGIPEFPYWRNHFQDEAFVLGLLFKMGPNDLNPHYFINPTLHYYTLLATAKIASFLGLINGLSLPVKTNELGQPTSGFSLADYAMLYRVGRLLSIVEGILVIVLMFLIGRNLYNEFVGVVTAVFTAVLPTMVYQCHFLVVDAPAVFWFVLAFWFLTTRIETFGLRRWSMLCGIFMGIAIGTKYTNALLFLAFFYKLYHYHRSYPLVKRVLNRDAVITIFTAIAFFILTTPYMLLSFNEFMKGNANGFGGIFGARGLLYYNAYPANLLSPFSPVTFQSLQLPLAILGALGLVYLFVKRNKNDVFLLFFIVPFYLMMIYHASPHLRHILLVLPFLMIGAARMLFDFVASRNAVWRWLSVTAAVIAFAYTLAFSLSLVLRMTPVDTRIECAEWMRKNANPQAVVGLASYFPWNYTPPVEMVLESIKLIDFNYDRLLSIKPDYFIITEYELSPAVSSRESAAARKQFISRLFEQRDYVIVKEFFKKFSILGITFNPHYPNMDWNPVNPAVYVFKLRS